MRILTSVPVTCFPQTGNEGVPRRAGQDPEAGERAAETRNQVRTLLFATIVRLLLIGWLCAL